MLNHRRKYTPSRWRNQGSNGLHRSDRQRGQYVGRARAWPRQSGADQWFAGCPECPIDFGLVTCFTARKRAFNKFDLFWMTDAQMARWARSLRTTQDALQPLETVEHSVHLRPDDGRSDRRARRDTGRHDRRHLSQGASHGFQLGGKKGERGRLVGRPKGCASPPANIHGMRAIGSRRRAGDTRPRIGAGCVGFQRLDRLAGSPLRSRCAPHFASSISGDPLFG